MMNKKLTVVISDYDFGELDIERAEIEGAGFRLVAGQCKSEDELIEIARDAAAIITQYARVGERTINALKECKLIARYGVGVDIVDVEAATRRNILVTNVRDYCTDEVADHAMALLLATARKVRDYDRATRAGVWHWQTGRPIHRMKGRTMGLLAFGRIARVIGARGKAFGVNLIAYDPYVSAEDFATHGAKSVSFDQLIELSDYLMIQVPLTDETRGMVGETQLRRMKSDAILINTSRGPVVDNKALFKALKEGWIAGAGIDDTEEEPANIRNWKPDNPLFTLKNIYITPHTAYYSEESITTARQFAAREVVRVLSGEKPLSPVNAVPLAG